MDINPKSPETDVTTDHHQTGATRIQSPKPLTFTNGVLKRHQPQPQHRHHQHHPIVVTYKECLKNHAASLGGHALDGCGEFMPSPTATPSDPTSLKCAACGCHRNFHRRETDQDQPHIPTSTTATIEYQPHHRHHPPPPPPLPVTHPPQLPSQRSPNSASPPPISSSYYPSAPHMLLALSGNLQQQSSAAAAAAAQQEHNNNNNNNIMMMSNSGGRKRFRTKFSQSQKEKMFEFAERVGWKMQKRDEDLVHEFCNEVGVDRNVLKVWMHNNKNTFAKRDLNGSGSVGGRMINLDDDDDDNNTGNHNGNGNNNIKSGTDGVVLQNLNHQYQSSTTTNAAAAAASVAHVANSNGGRGSSSSS